MGNKKEIHVPDIGDFDKVPVIEVLVSEGDSIEKEQSLVTLESDKATMEVPSPESGKLVELKVKEGDEVSEGDVIGVVEVEGASEGAEDDDDSEGSDESSDRDSGLGTRDSKEDSGGGAEQAGEEGDKDGGSEDSTDRDSGLGTRDSKEDSGDGAEQTDEGGDKYGGAGGDRDSTDASGAAGDELQAPPVPFGDMDMDPGKLPHASPSVRRMARELGVDLAGVKGSGRNGRITEDDLKAHVKQAMQSGAGVSGGGLSVADPPRVDFSKFGEVEEEKLSRIKRISGPNLHRNWVSIPHVTQFDKADITEMEAFRKANQERAEKAGTKMTPLVFLIKAVVAALREFPHFNASLSLDGETLIRKKYFHIGVAVDTPNGLMVPVLRDCDRKGLLELAVELTELSGKARDGKLSSKEMQGGCLSISSLGGIGGTAFTPIINAPELAILGVSRAETRPRWNGAEFEPRLMLPLSLSYDHRVIDGADAARFTRYLAGQLEDVRRLLL